MRWFKIELGVNVSITHPDLPKILYFIDWCKDSSKDYYKLNADALYAYVKLFGIDPYHDCTYTEIDAKGKEGRCWYSLD